MTTGLDYEIDYPDGTGTSNRRSKTAKDTIVRAEKKRPQTAVDYEDKVKSFLHTVLKSTADSESTVPDAAAIIKYGPDFAEKTGDLAEHDPRVRKAIDLITAPDNPYFAFIMAAAPLAIQIIRNHESDNQVESRELKVPFLKRKFRLRFRLRLKNKWFRAFTSEPKILAKDVFSDPAIAKALKDEGIDVAYP
jgi:hypothetical protein